MARLVGAVDVGTSRVKAVAVTAEGEVVRAEEVRLELSAGGGRAEHDPARLLRAVRWGLGRLREWGAACAGLSVYRGSVVAWERGGRPLTPVVTWMDRAGLTWRPPLPARLARLLPLLRTALLPGSPALTMGYLLERHGLRDGVCRGEVYVWTLDAFLAYSLSGRYVGDPASMGLTGLINPLTLRRLPLVARLLGLECVEEPEPLPHDEVLAEVGGVEVGPIIADQQAAVVGLGCARPGYVKVTMGTGVFVDAVVDGPRLPLSADLIPVLVLHARRSRLYGVEGFAAGVGASVDLAVELGLIRGYEELEEAVEPPSDAVAVPLLGGSRTPYLPEAGLLIAVLNPTRGRGELARAVAHGVAAVAAAVLRRVVGYVGAVREVRVGGGLARSRVLVQLLADYSGLELRVASDPYDSARGAAVLAARACGLADWPHEGEVRVRLRTVRPRGGGEVGSATYELLKRKLGAGLWRALRGYLDLLRLARSRS